MSLGEKSPFYYSDRRLQVVEESTAHSREGRRALFGISSRVLQIGERTIIEIFSFLFFLLFFYYPKDFYKLSPRDI